MTISANKLRIKKISVIIANIHGIKDRVISRSVTETNAAGERSNQLL
ncbi:MAG: hypothetical protein LBB81_09090 [Treponema sp.]|nr:hypothetical protein [Treponema sp.]